LCFAKSGVLSKKMFEDAMIADFSQEEICKLFAKTCKVNKRFCHTGLRRKRPCC